ncbi:MAG: zinc-ribbon domain-containing protein, partial [Saccharofermentans sp.]|nr:zinc-ribbon domain-containing protein [Saccharofermentans sp.]
MHCPNCGKELKDTQKFCGGCGTNVEKFLAEKPAVEPEVTAGAEAPAQPEAEPQITEQNEAPVEASAAETPSEVPANE